MLARVNAFFAAVKNHPLWLIAGLVWSVAVWFVDKKYGDAIYRWLTSEQNSLPLILLVAAASWIADRWVAANFTILSAWLMFLFYRMWAESRPASEEHPSGRKRPGAVYPTAAEISAREKRLEALRLLHEVGTHMLLNRPPSDDLGRLTENLDWWDACVQENAKAAGASDDAVRRFAVLSTNVPAPGGPFGRVRVKLPRLDQIIDEVEATRRKDFDSLTEAFRAFRGTVISSVDDPDHARKIVRIKALAKPKVTREDEETFRAIEATFECLGYRVIGWPSS